MAMGRTESSSMWNAGTASAYALPAIRTTAGRAHAKKTSVVAVCSRQIKPSDLRARAANSLRLPCSHRCVAWGRAAFHMMPPTVVRATFALAAIW